MVAYVHGDNFVVLGLRRQLQKFAEDLGEKMLVNVEGVLGPSSETTAPPCRVSFASDILPARFALEPESSTVWLQYLSPCYHKGTYVPNSKTLHSGLPMNGIARCR